MAQVELHTFQEVATVAAGQTFYWEYWWGDVDAGVCYASASPGEWLGHQTVIQQGVTAGIDYYPHGFLQFPGKRTFRYTAAILNDSPAPVSYSLRVTRTYQ